MKLYKKALLATAIVGSFGVNAATVSSTPLKLSAEGVAAKLTADNQDLSIDFVVGALTPAASTITLTFDSTIDLTDFAAAATAGTENVINNVGTGKGEVKVGGVGGGALLATFDYGTGSFTFDKFKVDAKAGTLTFDVNLGNPVTANSAFRLTIDGAGSGLDVDGPASVAYRSVDSLDNEIETGTGVIAVTETQFGFKIKQPWNGLIERLAQDTFSKNSDTGSDEKDSLIFTFTNNATALKAALTQGTHEVLFTGAFGKAADIKAANFTAAKTAGAAAPVPAMVVTGTQNVGVKVPMAADNTTLDGKDANITVTFTGNKAGDLVIPQTGAITAKATMNYTDGAGGTLTLASAEDAGKWALDATIINIPYFPVNFSGLSTSVHFANESANDADVIVTAIDDMAGGETHTGTLPALKGDTVTRYKQADIIGALGLDSTKSYKLSVTFNIDANTGDVNAYAFSNAGDARQALVTSQQKGSNQ